jgi:hypothetical protein
MQSEGNQESETAGLVPVYFPARSYVRIYPRPLVVAHDSKLFLGCIGLPVAFHRAGPGGNEGNDRCGEGEFIDEAHVPFGVHLPAPILLLLGSVLSLAGLILIFGDGPVVGGILFSTGAFILVLLATAFL